MQMYLVSPAVEERYRKALEYQTVKEEEKTQFEALQRAQQEVQRQQEEMQNELKERQQRLTEVGIKLCINIFTNIYCFNYPLNGFYL